MPLLNRNGKYEQLFRLRTGWDPKGSVFADKQAEVSSYRPSKLLVQQTDANSGRKGVAAGMTGIERWLRSAGSLKSRSAEL